MKILLSGSSGGIGKAIAEIFAENGHEVTGLDVLPPAFVHPLFKHVETDVVTGKLPEGAFDIIINSAGVQNSGRDIDVNLKGAMRVTENYLCNSVKSVLFIASASATTGSEFPEYVASKGGLVAYMKNVALRIAEWGATANSLSPGGVYTSLNRRVMQTPELWKRIMDVTPLKKWATAREIAEWAYFITAVNKSMTAQDILIDNGESSAAKFIW